MGFSIGLRVYRLSICDKYSKKELKFADDDSKTDLLSFIKKFVVSYSGITDREELQRIWFFEPKDDANARVVCGYIRYGTYGCPFL